MQVKHLMRALGIGWALIVAAWVPPVEAQADPCVRKGRTYRVRIDSAPQQAAVYVGDKKCGIAGYTPWTGRLPNGVHKVIVEKKGWAATERSVKVLRTRRLQETFVPMQRQPEPGLIEVRADADPNASGAEVWISGQNRGTVPLTEKVPEGRYLVEIRKAQFDRFQQWVEVKEDQRVTINPVLKNNAVGSLLVNADVPEAEIYLDGNKVDETTPAMITGVAAGPHVVEVRKAPAMPWRQSVSVEANKTTKVTAELKATMGGAAGNIQILSNVQGATVWLDGKRVGRSPMTIEAVKPGEHVIELRSRGYRTREERVKVSAGAGLVLKLDLQRAAAGLLRVTVGVPGAEIFVDGKKLDPEKPAIEVSTGEHFVVVTKEGYAKYEEKIKVAEGKDKNITVELKAIGGLRFLSTPSGAEVILNSKPIGRTPMVNEAIAAGEHVVTLRMEGYYDHEEPVTVEGGELKVVRATLQTIDTGPTEAELRRRQKGLTSYGARTLPRGSSTMDFGFGYPYFFDGRITVGVGDIKGRFGLDAGVLFRTFLSRTELGVTGRLTLFDRQPISFGVWGNIGGGSNFVDESGRNTFFLDGGAAASLTGLGAVTVTGRAYLSIWSDRHCPVKENGIFLGDPGDICVDFDNGTLNTEQMQAIQRTLGDDSPLDRDTDARFMASLLVEVALRQRWNVWLLFEGAPLQDERAAFTDAFNGTQLEQDVASYIRAGATWKFTGM
jgi:hypothetical protein